MVTQQILRSALSTALSTTLIACLAACASTPPPTASHPIAVGEPAAALKGKRYLEYRVGTNIKADAASIWAVLTDAQRYPEWNSTIVRIDGDIALDQEIKLVAKIDPKRTFKLEVTRFEPDAALVWQDGNGMFKGVRTFQLRALPDGSTDVTMSEVLTGAMLPMIEKKLPDFRPSFDSFVADLKTQVESRTSPTPE